MKYKLIKDFITGEVIEGKIQRLSDNAFIPFDPANTDYANFKRDILSGTTTIQDADGVEMTAAAAQEFVQGLP